jgi:hypothetical protein
VKVWLPDTNLKEIGVEVKEQSFHLQTPNYLLNHILPYKVNKDKSDAKWDKEKGLLLITVNLFLFVCLFVYVTVFAFAFLLVL